MTGTETAEKTFEREMYLWEYDTDAISEDIEMDSDRQEFVQTVMQENLNHARHVENERMSLVVGISALVAGVLSVGGSMLTQALSSVGSAKESIVMLELLPVLGIYFVTLVVLLIAKVLNSRWNMTFDRHIYYAKGCYYLLHKSTFGNMEKYAVDDCLKKKHKRKKKINAKTGGRSRKEKTFNPSANAFKESFSLPLPFGEKMSISTMPLYCFDINKNADYPKWFNKIGTKQYFSIFYWLLIFVVVTMFVITAYIAVWVKR